MPSKPEVIRAGRDRVYQVDFSPDDVSTLIRKQQFIRTDSLIDASHKLTSPPSRNQGRAARQVPLEPFPHLVIVWVEQCPTLLAGRVDQIFQLL
jgi:hypothetical protein